MLSYWFSGIFSNSGRLLIFSSNMDYSFNSINNGDTVLPLQLDYHHCVFKCCVVVKSCMLWCDNAMEKASLIQWSTYSIQVEQWDFSDLSREFLCMVGDELGSPPPQIGDLSSSGALTSVLGTGTLLNNSLLKATEWRRKSGWKWKKRKIQVWGTRGHSAAF